MTHHGEQSLRSRLLRRTPREEVPFTGGTGWGGLASASILAPSAPDTARPHIAMKSVINDDRIINCEIYPFCVTQTSRTETSRVSILEQQPYIVKIRISGTSPGGFLDISTACTPGQNLPLLVLNQEYTSYDMGTPPKTYTLPHTHFHQAACFPVPYMMQSCAYHADSADSVCEGKNCKLPVQAPQPAGRVLLHP